MANMLFANNANTTLASSLSAGATSMSVTSASAFPSPTGVQYFYCTLADAATQTTIEIVKVTSVSGTTFAITRAQDGTSATAFAAGAVVSLRLVRASLNDFPKLDETNTFNADQAISGQLTSSAGLATTGTFTATAPSDGLVMDYATGFGRFSAFAGDGFQWYNAGIANTKLMQLSSSGVITTATWNGATVGVGYGGTGLTAVTAGYIPFGSTSSALSTDSNLFWDATNHRLGIGTTSPAAALDVYGDGAFLTQRNATSAGGYGGLWAMDYAFFSGPSYKGVGIEQYGTTATGTTCGLANAGLGQLIFQNNAGGLIYTNQNVPLYFGTSGTERMRLDSSGNLLVGTTTASARFTVVSANPAYLGGWGSGIGTGLVMNTTVTNANSDAISFAQNGTQVGHIQTTSVGTTLYLGTSDQRLKTDLGVSTDTSVIDNTIIHNFTWNKNGQKDVGVFAQEAQKIKPLAVYQGEDLLDNKGNLINPWGVDYSLYVPDIIVYCQQLKATILSLEAKLKSAGVAGF